MTRPKKENNRNQRKQQPHSRPGTPELQPKKKQNTLQTVEPENSMSSNNNNDETPLMDVDPSPLDKGKGKEVLQSETTLVVTNKPSEMNVDDANDASENFLNNKRSPLDISTKKTKFFAYFPTDDYPGKSPQTKVSDVTDLVFDRFDSFSGINLAKHPEDQSKSILKATFSDKGERDAFCNVNLPNLEKRTFLPLDIVPKHPYVPQQSVKVTEIPLDATELRIKKIFSRFGKIVRFAMETKNLWQQATITYDSDANFTELKKGYGVFILNDMVRFHMCDLSKDQILERSKFSAKLTCLPRYTTGKDLSELGVMTNATTWIIPKARSNYNNLQHAFFYFASADDHEAAISNNNLTINGKHVEWTSNKTQLCAICSSPHHKIKDCPKKRRTPNDRNTQNLYQRFQPAQYDNYKAPPRLRRGAVNLNVTFARVAKGRQEEKPSPPKKPKFGISNNEDGSFGLRGPNNIPLPSWADDVPFDMDIINNTLTPIESRDNNLILFIEPFIRNIIRLKFLILVKKIFSISFF